MPEPEKIFEAEVVKRGDAHDPGDESSRMVEHVEVKRIGSGAFFARSAFSFVGNAEAAHKRMRVLTLRLWMWLVGLLVIAGGCFCGAWVVESKLFGAMFIFCGVLVLAGAGIVWFLMRALRRLSTLGQSGREA